MKVARRTFFFKIKLRALHIILFVYVCVAFMKNLEKDKRIFKCNKIVFFCDLLIEGLPDEISSNIFRD